MNMSRRIALITILLVCFNDETARAAVDWETGTCQFEITEDKPKESLYTFPDAPSGTTADFTIKSQNGSKQFAISSDGGVLSSKIKLDYESDEKLYSVEIIYTKSAADDLEKVLTKIWKISLPSAAEFLATHSDDTLQTNLICEVQVIDANDVRPKFLPESYSMNIPNNVAKDTSMLIVSATDGDVSEKFNQVVYSIKEGVGSGNFSIISDTGLIKAAINVTGPQTFKINVTATDKAKTEFTDEASVSICIRCASGSSSLEISMFAFIALVFSVVLM